MDKFDRIFRLHAILASRRTPVSLDELKRKLDCSKATVHRTINALKDYLAAPIVFDSERQGYRYTADAKAPEFELPGLWFTPAELQALALMQRLLQEAGRGLLEEHVGALTKRLNELTGHKRLNLTESDRRLKFPALAARPAAWRSALTDCLEKSIGTNISFGSAADESGDTVETAVSVTIDLFVFIQALSCMIQNPGNQKDLLARKKSVKISRLKSDLTEFKGLI